MKKFTVKEINVKKYRIICLVVVQLEHAYSNEIFAQKLLKIMPTLASHKCKNSSNNSFFEEIKKTSLAHVFEHIVIDLQIKYLSENGCAENTSILGTTEWFNKNQGMSKVELSYCDDLLALKAIKEAEKLINQLL